MTSLLEAITRRLHPSEDEPGIEGAAKAHHDRLTGHDLSLEERRDRARRLGTKKAPACPDCLAG